MVDKLDEKNEKMKKDKIYKDEKSRNTNMLPGDRNGLPDEFFSDETLVFIDAGFISKLSKYFGNGNYMVYDLISFAKNISKKQKLNCKQIFYYTAPPFQSEPSIRREEIKKEGYDKFIKTLRKRGVVVREGRCQRLKIDDKFVFRQKAVDILIAVDLMKVPLKYSKIKKIILVACDSDFVPVIHSLREFGIKTILWTYYEKKRNTNFSRSNDLIKSVYKYVLLSKQNFIDAPLENFIK